MKSPQIPASCGLRARANARRSRILDRAAGRTLAPAGLTLLALLGVGCGVLTEAARAAEVPVVDPARPEPAADSAKPVSWNNSGMLSLSNGRFLSWSSSVPCIHLISGRALLQGNYFTDSIGLAIRSETTINRVMVLGNMLCGNTVSLAGPTITSANNQP